MTTRQAPRHALYSVHPSVAHGRAILAHLPDTTGRSLDAWVRLLKKCGLRAEADRRTWLKTEHGLGGTTARLIVERADGKGKENTDPDAYLRAAAGHVEAMYAGARASLRPIHDDLLRLARRLGPDIKVCPCKTIVPLYRAHVFAEIKPATRTRIDLGLALKGTKRKPPRRVVDTAGLARNDRITHKIALSSVDDIDDQVRRWLKTAYELDT